MQTPSAAQLQLGPLTLGEPLGEAPLWRAEPGLELTLEARELASNGHHEPPLRVAAVLVQLITV